MSELSSSLLDYAVPLPTSPAAHRPESNDATMGSSAESIASLLLGESTSNYHAELQSPIPLPGTAAKRERSEGDIVDGTAPEVPSPHGWRRTHETMPPQRSNFMLPNAATSRRPPSYDSTTTTPLSGALEAELRKEISLLSQSYRELQHMYGEKCGEVVVLRRRLEEAQGGGGGSSFPRRVESVPRGVPQFRRDIDAESLVSCDPSATASTAASTAAKLCCELCDVYVTSERSLLYHKEGERHRKRVARYLQDNGLKTSPSPK